MQLFIFFVLPLLAMYFLILRPNRRKMADRELMVANLSLGDAVITLGGIHGEIVELDEGQTLVLKLEDGSEVRFDRRAMQQIVRDEEEVVHDDNSDNL